MTTNIVATVNRIAAEVSNTLTALKVGEKVLLTNLSDKLAGETGLLSTDIYPIIRLVAGQFDDIYVVKGPFGGALKLGSGESKADYKDSLKAKRAPKVKKN
jgi:hypothetical protein